MHSWSKKAMSPLIATVLLIAFAVALGAMIMNWSADVSVKESHCEGLSITSSNGACYANNTLRFTVQNDGTKRVDALRLIISTSTSDSEITVKDSTMIIGETLQKTLPLLYDGGSIEISYLPLTLVNGEYESCKLAGFIQRELPNCS